MPIEFSYAVPSTGAPTEYHVLQQIGLDYVSHKTNVTVASFVSKDMFDAGKQPVYQQVIQIDGLPAYGSDPKDYVEADLIAPAPTDGSMSTSPNRYLFAGATIVS
ncbi:hypothetical protein [Burkholderia vietnamiensis]|uniref:hypothetical protein n=1 Tax=Burkholderia vietnamiensis TaxID=60552 RepID=UPI0008422625|nr:hypothetical protein [Burkholderia vietnamiensis]AOK00342.1 hypothetical protein WK23_17890 [Burkholderia vietnamiensis]